MYYTTNEVAQLLGYTSETVRRKIRSGEIEAFKVKDKLRIPKEEVARYLDNIIKISDVSSERKDDIINNLIINR